MAILRIYRRLQVIKSMSKECKMDECFINCVHGMDGTDQYLVTSEQQMFWECCLMWMTMVEVKSATPTHLGPMAADGA